MKTMLIQQLLSIVMTMLGPEVIKPLLDNVLDTIEEAVKKSDNPMDNLIILPLCQTIRNTFDIPDNDIVPGPWPGPIGPLNPPIHIDPAEPGKTL